MTKHQVLDSFLYKQGTHIILLSNKFPLSGICFAVEQSLLQIVNLRYAGPQVKKKARRKMPVRPVVI
jgi:hypothetical protein